MTTCRKSAGLAAPMRVATARLSWISATSLSSPMRWRQRVSDELERELMAEELLAAEQLVVRVLDPARAYPRHDAGQGLCGVHKLALSGWRLIIGFFAFDHRPPLALRDKADNANDPERLAAICWSATSRR